MSKANWVYRMTPGQAWDEFVALSVEMFMTLSYREGYTGISDACTSYSAEIPGIYNRPFLQSQLDHIAKLLKQHVIEYTDKLGGIDHLKMCTEEELDLVWDEMVDDILLLLNKFRKAPRH